MEEVSWNMKEGKVIKRWNGVRWWIKEWRGRRGIVRVVNWKREKWLFWWLFV